MEKNRKCLILIKNQYETNSTDFIEVIKMLIDNKIQLKLLIGSGDGQLDPFYFEQNIDIDILDKTGENKENAIRKIFQRNRRVYLFCLNIYLIMINLFFAFKYEISKSKDDYLYEMFLNEKMKSYKMDEQYDFIWVHDEYGLLWAKKIAEDRNIPLIYHCIELYWEHYLKQNQKKIDSIREYILFENVVKVLKNVNLIVIQDEKRWEILCKYTDVDKIDHVFLPVAIYDYQYDITDESKDKIVYYPTYIAEKRGCSSLIDIFNKIDRDDIKLEIQGIHADPAYLVRLKMINLAKTITISNQGLCYKELIEKHQKIWCVFVFYGESDNNDRYVVNSSNKLAMALQAGKPVISIGNQGINALCEKYQCGVVAKSWKEEDLIIALRELERNYEKYCYNARVCYEERYNMELFEKEVINAIEEVCK